MKSLARGLSPLWFFKSDAGEWRFVLEPGKLVAYMLLALIVADYLRQP